MTPVVAPARDVSAAPTNWPSAVDHTTVMPIVVASEPLSVAPRQAGGHDGAGFDADAFAEALARALAPIIAQRPQPVMTPGMMHSAPAVKPSFWQTARHVDVLLSIIALVIVLAVLAAWML